MANQFTDAVFKAGFSDVTIPHGKKTRVVPASDIKLVAYTLAWRCNDKGVCWPSYRDLHERTHLARSGCVRCVTAMVQEGLLVKNTGGKGRSNRYLMNLNWLVPRETTATREPSDTPDDGATGDQGGAKGDLPSATGDQGGLQLGNGVVPQGAPNSSVKASEKPSGEGRQRTSSPVARPQTSDPTATPTSKPTPSYILSHELCGDECDECRGKKFKRKLPVPPPVRAKNSVMGMVSRATTPSYEFRKPTDGELRRFADKRSGTGWTQGRIGALVKDGLWTQKAVDAAVLHLLSQELDEIDWDKFASTVERINAALKTSIGGFEVEPEEV